MASSKHFNKKYFDEQFKKLATKAQLDRVELSFDRRLSDQSRRLEDYIGRNFEAMEEDLGAKLDAMIELLDVRQRVEALERRVNELQK